MDELSLAGGRRPHFALIASLLVFLLVVWVGALHFVGLGRDEALAGGREQVVRMTESAETQVRQDLRLIHVFLGSARRWVEQHPASDPLADPGFQAIVDEFRGLAGEAVEISFAGDGGTPAAGNDPAAPAVGIPVQSQSSRHWVLPVSIGLPANPRKIGAIVATIGVAGFERQFKLLAAYPGASIALVRHDGILLARTPADEKRLARPYAADGAAEIVGRSALADYPVVVVTAVAVDEILASWRQRRDLMLAAAVVVSLLGVEVFLLLLRLFRRLDRGRDELSHLAAIDPMTGVLNRTTFMDILEREFGRCRRYAQPLSVMMLDIDFFKRINDGYGHSVGDDALRAFVGVLGHGLRNVDALGRLGGEEFAILLPNTAGEAAITLADRLREKVAGIVVNTPNEEEVRFTTSVGVSSIGPDDTVDALFLRTDRALQRAKAGGRNRAELLLVESSPPADT